MKHNLEKEYVNCSVCGQDDAFLIEGIDHEYPDTTDDVFKFVRCNRCRSIYLNPRPAISELQVIYPDNYYAFHLSTTSNKKSRLSPKKISAIFERRRLTKIATKYCERPQTVFDIGCGDGFSLELFKQVLGDSIETFGVEMNAEAAEQAKRSGHNVQQGLFEELNFDGKCYDIVFSSHVIEHVASPAEFLRKAHQIMNVDGVLVIDTPNVDSLLFRIFGRHWGGWHTPRHWNLFDPSTIEKLARQNGLFVKEVQYMPINMYWIWGLHSLFFERNRKIADKFFDPVATGTGGLRSIFLLSLAQFLELILKLCTQKTSQMRVIMSKRETLPGINLH